MKRKKTEALLPAITPQNISSRIARPKTIRWEKLNESRYTTLAMDQDPVLTSVATLSTMDHKFSCQSERERLSQRKMCQGRVPTTRKTKSHRSARRLLSWEKANDSRGSTQKLALPRQSIRTSLRQSVLVTPSARRSAFSMYLPTFQGLVATRHLPLSPTHLLTTNDILRVFSRQPIKNHSQGHTPN